MSSSNKRPKTQSLLDSFLANRQAIKSEPSGDTAGESSKENLDPTQPPAKKLKSVGSDRTTAMRERFRNDPSLCVKLLDKLPFMMKGWCKLCTLKPSKAGGYIQVSYEGCNKFAMLQQIVLCASGQDVAEGEDCSHRCGNTACMTVGHIKADSSELNQKRKNCLVWVPCPHDCGVILVCQHGEADGSGCCIKYMADFSSQEDFEANAIAHRHSASA